MTFASGLSAQDLNGSLVSVYLSENIEPGPSGSFQPELNRWLLSGRVLGSIESGASGSLPPDSFFVSGKVSPLALQIHEGISGFLDIPNAGQRVHAQRRLLELVLSGSATSGVCSGL
jgi:hypothetical protein